MDDLKEQIENVCSNLSRHIDPQDIAAVLRVVAKEYDSKA